MTARIPAHPATTALAVKIIAQVEALARGAQLARYGYECERILVGENESPDVTEARILARMDQWMRLKSLSLPGGQA